MCGIVGEVSKERTNLEMGVRLRDALTGIQNRGHEAAGIFLMNGLRPYPKKGRGYVDQAISLTWAQRKKGHVGIGQVRYSTMGAGVAMGDRRMEADAIYDDPFEEGDSWKVNVQPFFDELSTIGSISLVHNGNLTNALTLKKELQEKRPTVFRGTTDTEVLLKLVGYFIEVEECSIVEAIRKAMGKARGAFSCILLTSGGLYAFRDKKGFRPLFIAETNESFIFASEENAWHTLNATKKGEVEPGEIIEARIGYKTLKRHKAPKPSKRGARCIFELVYLQFGGNPTVAQAREKYGEVLFKRHPRPGLVIPVPESGIGAAMGYHNAQVRFYGKKSGFFQALFKHPTIGRTFLEPEDKDRISKIKMKYNFLLPQIDSHIRYLASFPGPLWLNFVDDSLVRSNTARIIIKIVRQQLKETYPGLYKRIKISWLLSCPPYTHPCYFGIDTYEDKSLAASPKRIGGKRQPPLNEQLDDLRATSEKVRRIINASYVGYLSRKDMIKISAKVEKLSSDDFCHACFSGEYPVPIDPKTDKRTLAEE